MIPETYQQILLLYLSNLAKDRSFREPGDLAELSGRELLDLADKVDDEALGPMVYMLKTTHKGRELFEKLMGDHEEENRHLVDEFFSRYMKMVLQDAERNAGHNPLELYLPPETFDDLVFVQSRQAFFLRQTADTINEFLTHTTSRKQSFKPGEQEEAWEFFWEYVTHK